MKDSLWKTQVKSIFVQLEAFKVKTGQPHWEKDTEVVHKVTSQFLSGPRTTSSHQGIKILNLSNIFIPCAQTSFIITKSPRGVNWEISLPMFSKKKFNEDQTKLSAVPTHGPLGAFGAPLRPLAQSPCGPAHRGPPWLPPVDKEPTHPPQCKLCLLRPPEPLRRRL